MDKTMEKKKGQYSKLSHLFLSLDISNNDQFKAAN